MYGFVDNTGRVMVEPQYESIENYTNEWALVKKNGKIGYIDKAGKEIVAPIYDKVVNLMNIKKIGFLLSQMD